MNITIIQDNTRNEQLGANGAQIIHKLYELATDPNNTVTLSGNLYSLKGYKVEMDYLNNTYSPNFIINIPQSGQYISFTDPEFERIMKQYISSDNVGVTVSDLQSFQDISSGSQDGSLSKNLQIAFNNNTTLTSLIDLLKCNSLTRFGSDSFSGCTNVTEIGIPASLTSIGSNFLWGVSSINKVVVENLDSYLNLQSCYTPPFEKGSNVKLYTIQSGQEVEVKNLTITNNAASRLFEKCKSIESVTFSNDVTSINAGIFNNCTNLTTINFPSNIQSIGNNAFYGCNITSVDLSNTKITTANPNIFGGGVLKSIKYPNTLTTYGRQSSADPTGSNILTEIRGLDNVTTIYGRFCGNITHAVNMSLLQTGYAPIYSTSDGSIYSTINQLYMKSLKYYQPESYSNLWSMLQYNCMFGYRIRDDHGFTQIGLLYFKDLEKIHTLQFYAARIKNLIINSVTPPIKDDTGITYNSGIENIPNYSYWQSSLFGTIPTSGTSAMIIYVPDSAVATYQADSNYNSYTIRGINEINPDTNAPYLTRYATNELWEAAGKPTDALIEEYM